jgi:hypothetical protein
MAVPSVDQDSWVAEHNDSPMGGHVSHSGRRLAANEDCKAAQGNHVWRPNTDKHIADAGSR